MAMVTLRGMGDTTLTAEQVAAAAPLATVSPFALPTCAWYQSTSTNATGPLTCQFDIKAALVYAPEVLATVLSTFTPVGASGISPNALIALSAIVVYGIPLYLLFGGSKKGKQ